MVCATLLATAGCGSSPQIAAGVVTQPNHVRVQTLRVTEAPAATNFTATGTIRPLLTASLSSQVTGRVIRLNVREGDLVALGDSLVEIDSRDLQSGVGIAAANYQASLAQLRKSQVSAIMVTKANSAKIQLAQAKVAQARAALAEANARRDETLAGTRVQDLAKSHLRVVETKSNLSLAKIELDRTQKLVTDGALAQRELDLAKNRYEVAQAENDSAGEAENLAREGSRSQEIIASQSAVTQAKESLSQAISGLAQEKANALESQVSRQESDAARAQTKQASAELEAAKVSLSHSQISAPFDGRVTERKADPGSMAIPGTPLLSIEGGDFRLEAVIPESVISSVFLGEKVPVSIDAVPNLKISGSVVEIDPRGDSSSHTFLVKLSLEPQAHLRSGMYGRAAIPTGQVNRISVPTEATWTRDGLSYVFVVNPDGVVRLRIVTTGEPSGKEVEVFSGLHSGDCIVIGDRSSLADGVKVEAGQE